MEIKPRPSSVIVFLAAIAAVLSIFIFLTIGQQTRYLTQIQESVSGLQPGARVEYNGVIVGKVKRVRIDERNPKLIDVMISVDKSTPVTTATIAMLASNDSKDAPFIALSDDGSQSSKLHVSPGQRYPIIPSTLSTKANINLSLTQIAQSLKQFNDTFQALMTKDDIEAFRQMVYSMQVVVGMLAENNERLSHIIINTEKASNQFDTFLSSGRVTLLTLQNETLPSTYHLMNNMEELLGKMNSLMNDVKQNPSVMLRGKAAPQPGPGE
jgi:phospholipid/cholesterol/gamma-HCH transport system substrate-binding protein